MTSPLGKALAAVLRRVRRRIPLGAPVMGQVDQADHRILRGWAWEAERPHRRLVLDIFHRGIFLGQAFAGAYRPDLAAHGIGDGRHHFIFHLPDDVPPAFTMADITVSTAGPVRRTIPASADLAPTDRTSHRLPGDPRHVLGPTVAAMSGRRDEAVLRAEPGPRGRLDPLCAEEPSTGLSAFLVHIARKYGRSVSRPDQQALLRWYLESYAVERGPDRAPIPECDQTRLLAGEGDAPSIVATLISREADASDRHRACRWAAEASCRLFVEDCLVSEAQREQAREVPREMGSDVYPLSAFMRLCHAEWAMLRRYRVGRERDRRAIYLLLLVVALRRPSLVTLMPSLGLQRLFAEAAPTDALLRRIFGEDTHLDAAMLLRRLREAGVSTADWSWDPHRYRGHRISRGAMAAAGKAGCDVQLVGPLRSDTGLGESCRRVARALLRTGLSVNLVDHAIGGAAGGVDAGLPLAELRTARLNVLHLNLDEIPEALAFLPDVFSGRPTVAMPYWELSAPAAVHRLGLAVVDELWVASRFLAEVFAATVPVHWIGMSCDEDAVPSLARRVDLRRSLAIDPSTFLFLTVSDARSWMQRKNPLGVIEAFRDAFAGRDDVALVVKTHNADAATSFEQERYWRGLRELCAGDARISFVNASFDRETQRALLAAADCFVTLHRAEGLGLDALDAMRRGTAVVATAYSGVMDVCTPDTAWLVDADRVAVGPSDYCFVEPGHIWAAPRHEAAVAAMREVHANRHRREEKMAAARRFVEETATTQAFSRRLELRIRRTLSQERQTA